MGCLTDTFVNARSVEAGGGDRRNLNFDDGDVSNHLNGLAERMVIA